MLELQEDAAVVHEVEQRLPVVEEQLVAVRQRRLPVAEAVRLVVVREVVVAVANTTPCRTSRSDRGASGQGAPAPS